MNDPRQAAIDRARRVLDSGQLRDWQEVPATGSADIERLGPYRGGEIGVDPATGRFYVYRPWVELGEPLTELVRTRRGPPPALRSAPPPAIPPPPREVRGTDSSALPPSRQERGLPTVDPGPSPGELRAQELYLQASRALQRDELERDLRARFGGHLPRRAPGFFVSMVVPEDDQVREAILDATEVGAEVADISIGFIPVVGELIDAYEAVSGEEAAIFARAFANEPGLPWHGRDVEQLGAGERAVAGASAMVGALTIVGGRIGRLARMGSTGTRIIARIARRMGTTAEDLVEVAARLRRLEASENDIARALTRAAQHRRLTGREREVLEELAYALEPLRLGDPSASGRAAQRTRRVARQLLRDERTIRAAERVLTRARGRLLDATGKVYDLVHTMGRGTLAQRQRAAAELAGIVEASERPGTRYLRVLPDPSSSTRLHATDAIHVRRGQPHQRYEVTSITVMGDLPLSRVSADPVENLARRIEAAIRGKADSRQFTDEIEGRSVNAFGEVHVVIAETLGYSPAQVQQAANWAFERLARRGTDWAPHVRGTRVSLLRRSSERDLDRFLRGEGEPPGLDVAGSWTRRSR